MKAKRPYRTLPEKILETIRPTTKPRGESLFLYLPAVSNLAGNPSFLLRHVNWKIDWPFSALNLVGSLSVPSFLTVAVRHKEWGLWTFPSVIPLISSAERLS
jgi:hypothetical protein